MPTTINHAFCSAEFLLKALISWCFTYNPLNLAWIFYYSQGIVRIFYYFQGIVRDLDLCYLLKKNCSSAGIELMMLRFEVPRSTDWATVPWMGNELQIRFY